MTAQKPKLIVVLGMHRSGTSVVTRGLLTMGVSLGDHMLPPVKGDNDKGYWEDIDINALNVEMLHAIGSDWHHLKPVGSDDVEKLRDAGYLQRAVELLLGKLRNKSIFGFKDPRTAKLFPFWKEVFNACQLEVSYILVVRNPISVARSLLKRTGMTSEHAYLLWLGHILESLIGSIENSRTLVDYDLLITSPNAELARIAESLGLKIIPEEQKIYKEQFLDETLRHTLFNAQEALLDKDCPTFVREIYSVLLGIAQGKFNLSSAEVKVQIEDWAATYARIKEPLLLIDQLALHKALTGVQLAEQDNQIVNLKKQIIAHENQPNALNKVIADRDCQLGNLHQSIAELTEQTVGLRQEIESRNIQLAACKAEIETILDSTSWALTAPIRNVGNGIKRVRAYWRFAQSIIAALGISGLIKKSIRALRTEGHQGLFRRVRNIVSYYKATGQIGTTPAHAEKPDASDLIARVQNEGPKISVIISIYKTPIEMLRQAIESVTQQTYKNWELILVDDLSERDDIATLCLKYQERDIRIKYVARSENGNISAANNTGLLHATGSFFTILDHDDIFSVDALYQAAKVVVHHPEVDYIYSDEDKVTKDGLSFFGPFFKPDWSPEYMLAMMYTCHMSVFRKSLVMSLGAYNSAFDGAQDYELALRVVRHSNNIEHIAKVLYHWRVWENSTAQSMDAKPHAHELARKALEAHLREQGENFSISEAVIPGHHFVDFFPKRDSLISIIIPTANGSINIHGKTERHINAVCESILLKTSYKNFEIIVIHNGNLSVDQSEWLRSQKNIVLTEYTAEKFSLSEKINQGAKLAKGEYLVIMNDDIRVISEDWLTLMLGMAQREGVGAVGPKLLFPDETIQHAGVVMLGGLPGHPYYQHPKDALGYALGLQVNRNYLAVTGACCLTPKSVFDKLGGYSSKYPLNYNDVDYCLKVHKLGLRSVYIANALLYHYEGVSKEGGRTVATEEIQKFLADWGKEYENDPFYNVNLNQSTPYAF